MTCVVTVAGQSMAPTYRPGDILLTRGVGKAGLPQRGDVVVFRHAGTRMLKRVVALPGDRVELEAGRLFVNGESVDGRARVHGAYTASWRVPIGGCFVAGDNPAVSDDSRAWDEPFVRMDDLEAVVTRRLTGALRHTGLRPGGLPQGS